MDDIIQSRNRSMNRLGWLAGDRMWRIGNPFEWVDGDHQSYIYVAKGVSALMQAFSMYYEEYPTPKEIMVPDYSDMHEHYLETLGKVLKHFIPFAAGEKNWKLHHKCTALTRTQDYAFIKTFCKNLPKSPNHVDIGPGLGSHAVYSLQGLNSNYYGVEASAHMYEVQRQFFRMLSFMHGKYIDLVEAENFGFQLDQLGDELKEEYRIKHIPSWHFPLVGTGKVDLVTATWVLNEVNHAGILWLMSHAMRSLKKGGYFYIRDSANLKPGRHNIPYEEMLLGHGFTEVARLKVKNRENFFGIPRLYKKTSTKSYSFDELAEEYLGKFAITSHGGSYNQNMDKTPATKKKKK